MTGLLGNMLLTLALVSRRGSDLWNFNLKPEVRGGFAMGILQLGRLAVTLGVHANHYWRDHWARRSG